MLCNQHFFTRIGLLQRYTLARFVKEKYPVLHFHRNSSRHPFFQTNSKNITVKTMNAKEFDDFFP